LVGKAKRPPVAVPSVELIGLRRPHFRQPRLSQALDKYGASIVNTGNHRARRQCHQPISPLSILTNEAWDQVGFALYF
jgi:hypothetical protein